MESNAHHKTRYNICNPNHCHVATVRNKGMHHSSGYLSYMFLMSELNQC